MRILLVNSARTMRGGESQTLELGLRLRSRGIDTAFAVRGGSELAAALPAEVESLEARFEKAPLTTPLRLRRFSPTSLTGYSSRMDRATPLPCSTPSRRFGGC